MVNIYLCDEIMAELIQIAEAQNKELQEQGKRPIITSAKIAVGIIELWFLNRKGAKQIK